MAADAPRAIGVDADFDSTAGNLVLTVQDGQLALPVTVTVPLLAVKAIAAELLRREVMAELAPQIVERVNIGAGAGS